MGPSNTLPRAGKRLRHRAKKRLGGGGWVEGGKGQRGNGSRPGARDKVAPGILYDPSGLGTRRWAMGRKLPYPWGTCSDLWDMMRTTGVAFNTSPGTREFSQSGCSKSGVCNQPPAGGRQNRRECDATVHQ